MSIADSQTAGGIEVIAGQRDAVHFRQAPGSGAAGQRGINADGDRRLLESLSGGGRSGGSRRCSL